MSYIRQYLCEEAERITSRSLSDLPNSKEEWFKQRPKRLSRFLEMMGILDLPPKDKRTPLNIRVTGTLERNGYRVENLYYESLPRLYVTANLYIPNVSYPAPAVIYLCGHSPNAKIHYQAHARRFAQLGFVTLILDTLQFGEIEGYHHGCYRYGWFNWYSRGYTPGGVELWNGIRALDLLEERPEVDPERIGITGISGGGKTSWWLGAADERVRVVSPVCGTGTLAAHVKYRTIDGDCDCMYFINTYRWDLTDVAVLIAPRPLLICAAHRDYLCPGEIVKESFEKIKRVYTLLDSEDNISFIDTPGPHSYHSLSRKGIFAWFLKHLKGEDVPAEEIEDISEENLEPIDNLRVYKNGPPADERTSTIQDDFVPLASPPNIKNPDDLKAQRAALIETLLEKTFGHFPTSKCDLKYEVEMEYESSTRKFSRITFTTESEWRLAARLTLPLKTENSSIPVIIYLLSPGGPRWEAESFLSGFDNNWAHLVVELRGVGETSWDPSLSWHIRRASAATGRTIASMRVYDALRTIELVRTMPQLDLKRIILCGEGEMAAVGLYAALLDGGLEAIAVSKPPATQNQPSEPDGTGPAIEMLNCLRYTDLPYVAGLLWPMEIIFVGERPSTYKWSEELYAKLGPPGKISHVLKFANWRMRR